MRRSVQKVPYSFTQKSLLAAVLASIFCSHGLAAAETSQDGGYFHIPIWGLKLGDNQLKPADPKQPSTYAQAGKALLKVTPSRVDLRTRVIGSLVPPIPVTLTNVGREPIKIGATSTPHQFSVDQTCEGASLPPLASCTFSLSLVPVDTQKSEGYVDTFFSAGNDSAMASLFATAKVLAPETGSPAFTLSKAGTGEPLEAIDFGDSYIGDEAVTRSFIIRSAGTVPLKVTSLTPTEDFESLAVTSTCTGLMEPNTSCTVTASMKPLTAGAMRGALQLMTNSHDAAELGIPLTANVSEWARRLEYQSVVDFGIVDQGLQASQSIKVRNSGNLPVANLVPTVTSPFVISSNGCSGVTLQAEESCTITAAVTGLNLGEVTGTFKVSANDLTAQPVETKVMANIQFRAGTYGPLSLTFGERAIGLISAPQEVAFTNNSSIATTPTLGDLTSPSRSHPANGSNYQILKSHPWVLVDVTNCAAPVAPGSSCSMQIAVSPTYEGPLTAEFTAYPDKGMAARGANFTITAHGTKQAFVYAPTVLDFGQVAGKSYVTGKLEITNTSIDDAALERLSYSIEQPSQGQGTLEVVSTTCDSTLTQEQGKCVFNFRLEGASHAADETLESIDGAFKFRYQGAGLAYTRVPVKFLLRGNAPVVTIEGDTLDFGEIPVGLAGKNAPRKLVTVTNPGDSAFEITGVTYPDARTYGLTAAIDSAYPNACRFNSAIAPAQTCVIALYPTSKWNASWGQAEATVQLETRLNQQTKPFGPLLKMTAVHNKPETDLPEVLNYLAGEQKSFRTSQPYSIVNGASLRVNETRYSPIEGIEVTALWCAQDSTQSPTADNNCYLDISAEPQFGDKPRSRELVINADSSGTQRGLQTVTLNLETELAQYTIEGAEWHFGEVPAQGFHSDNESMSRSAVIRNTAKVASIAFKQIEAPRSSYGFVGTPLTVDGVLLSACENLTLAAGQACHWTATAGSASGAVVPSFEHTAVLHTDNAFGSISKAASATYLPGQLEVVSRPVKFVDVPSNTLSAPQVLVLRNGGKGNVSWGAQAGEDKATFSFVDSSGVPSTDFKFIVDGKAVQTVTPSVPKNKPASTSGEESCLKYSGLAPNATCSIELAMSPTGMSREYEANLVFNANLPEVTPLAVALEGNSLAAEVYFSSPNFVLPTDMALGTSYQGQITVGNGGNFPLQFNSVALRTTKDSNNTGNESGQTPESFPKTEVDLAHNCPQALEPGEECTLQLDLTPDRNANWLTADYRPYATLNESTYGVLHRQAIGVQGISLGGNVFVEPLVKELEGIESANVPLQLMYTVKVTSVGNSPVKFTSATNTSQHAEIVNSTCSPELTLTPGDSCTFDVQNRSNLHQAIGSWQDNKRWSWDFSPFGINGSVVDSENNIVSDRVIPLTFGGKAHQPPSGPTVVPSVISASRPVPTFITHSAIREGATVSVNGGEQTNPANIRQLDSFVTKSSQGPGYGVTPVAGTGAAQLMLPSNLEIGQHVATVKNPGVTAPYNAQFTVADFKLALPGEGEDVYTTVTGVPVSAYSSQLVRTFPSGGGVMLQTFTDPYSAKRVQTFSIIDAKGIITATVKAADTKRYDGAAARYSKVISDTELVFTELTRDGYGTVNLDTWRVTHSGASDIHVSLVDSINFGKMADTGSIFWDSDNNWVVGLQTAGSLWIKGVAEGVTFESAVPAFGQDPLSGLALVDGYIHALMGSNIFVADPTLLSQPSRYVYSAVFNEGLDNRIYYSPTSKTLISSCYGNTSLCTIPAGDGALGVAKLEAGLPAQAGLDDGSFAEARLAISYLLPVNNDSTAIGFQSSQGPRSTRLVNLSAIPAWGAIEAKDTTFTASIAQSGQAEPHVITLTNKSSLSLNVTGLSISGIPYTTTCNNVGYDQSCTVTVSLQESMWKNVLEGAFAIKTTVNYNVAVKWNVRFSDINRDPYWANVVYLMNMDLGANGSKAITEQKNNIPVTAVGTGTALALNTNDPKFGTASLAVAASGTAITLPAFNPAGDFTIEMWFKPQSSMGAMLSVGGVAGLNWQPISLYWGWPHSGVLNFMSSSANNGTDISCPTGHPTGQTCAVPFGAATINKWNHFAIVRSGPQYLLYLNGKRTAVVDKNVRIRLSNDPVVIGAYPNWSSNKLTYNTSTAANYDDIRFTDNVARYTGETYEVPARGFPAR